jgi:hypothetical protein
MIETYYNPNFDWEYNDFERIKALSTLVPISGGHQEYHDNKHEVIKAWADLCRIVLIEEMCADQLDRGLLHHECVLTLDIDERHCWQYGILMWDRALEIANTHPFSGFPDDVFMTDADGQCNQRHTAVDFLKGIGYPLLNQEDS